MMTKPNIFDFLDSIQFLNSYFSWRKSEDSRFSIASWSAEMGFASKVTLRFILKRRRNISDRSSAILAACLRLDSNEANYFNSLVAYTQATTQAEREAFGATLLRLQRAQFEQSELSVGVGAREVYTPIVLTVLTFVDGPKNVNDISQFIGVDSSIVERILVQMMDDGLIKKDANGQFASTETTYRIADHEGLKQYYDFWIEQSKLKLESSPESRRYRSLTFALSEADFKDITERINEYSLLLLTKYDFDTLAGRKLYMFNSTLFPVSRQFESQIVKTKRELDSELTEF